MLIREKVPISELTTMRLGGKARYVITIKKLSDIPEAYRFAAEKKLPVWVMGSGANTIGKDKGFDGVILLNRVKGIEVISETSDEVVIRAMGGENWDDLVAFACERGYSGIETMSKIPGTVGAAPVQNIGAYGQEMSQVLESVEVYDRETHELIVLGKEELNMDYRSTIFNTGPLVGRYFIVAVTIVLDNDEYLKPPFYRGLQKYIDEHNETDFSPANIRKMVMKIRAEKLPDPAKEASSGSFFKNIFLDDVGVATAESKGIKVWTKPNGKKMINSGYLIEGAGLKGAELHGMRVSDKAALVLINENAKCYKDLDRARTEIQEIVKEKYGFILEQEPVEIPTGSERSEH